MSILNAPWFIPLMVFIVIAGLAFLTLTTPGRRSAPPDDSDSAQNRTWQVQCPQCSRWKRLHPMHSNRMEVAEQLLRQSPQPGMHYQYVNQYKCPFCGHRWQETYVE